VSFAAIILYVASQRGFIVVVVYFIIDSVRKLLDTSSYHENDLVPLIHDIRNRQTKSVAS
jgi:hypothetical protein